MPRLCSFVRRVTLLWVAAAVINGASAAVAEPARIDVQTISSRTQRLLDQADSLLEAAQWADAIDTLTLVLQDSQGQLVEAEPGRYVPLADACHARLSLLPTEPLEQYRRSIDPAAQRLLQLGKEGRTPEPLRRLVSESFLSSYTPAALMLLADLALEQGDLPAARAALARVHPCVTGPTGRPVGLGLMNVDLTKHAAKVTERLTAPRRLIPPVCQADDAILPDALSRLVLASLQERDYRRAEIELNLLRLLAPTAAGHIAGGHTALADALQTLLNEARAWPAPPMPSAAGVLGGDYARTGAAAPIGEIIGPIWPEPSALVPMVRPRRPEPEVFIFNRGGINPGLPKRLVDTTRHPTARPIVYGPWVMVRDRSGVVVRKLLTGDPAITTDGRLQGAAPTMASPNARVIRQNGAQRLIIQNRILGFPQATRMAPALLSVSDGVLYTPSTPKQPTVEQRRAGHTPRPGVAGLSLPKDALEVVDLQPPEGRWSFSGPPIVVSGLAYIAVAADEVRPSVAVACYSISSGRLQWLTPVCSGTPPENSLAGSGADVLTKSGGTIYFNTNLGGVAAIDATSGAVEWIVDYPRTSSDEPRIKRAAPCILYRGRVLVSPTDSDAVFALDAASGRRLWSTERGGPGVPLLGAREGVLVAGGAVLTGLEVDTGRVRYQYPSSNRSGIRGVGIGCLAGEEVFWPTRDSIEVLNAMTGATTRPPISLAAVSKSGANLTPAHGLLVVAGPGKLTVFGPYPTNSAKPAPAVPKTDPFEVDPDLRESFK